MGPEEFESARRHQQQERKREKVRVKVGEEKAPDRVFVDRGGNHPGGGPEVVPVERAFVDEPLAQSGQVTEEDRETRAGEPGTAGAGPVAGERVRTLRDRSSQEPGR